MPSGGVPAASSRCSRGSPGRRRRCGRRTGTSTRAESSIRLRLRMGADPRTIVELSRALRAREIKAEQVTSSCLEQIAAGNPAINAFITVMADTALAQARQVDVDI